MNKNIPVTKAYMQELQRRNVGEKIEIKTSAPNRRQRRQGAKMMENYLKQRKPTK